MNIKKWKLDHSQEPLIISITLDRESCQEFIGELLTYLEAEQNNVTISFVLEKE